MNGVIYELRQYRTFPGRRDELVTLMTDRIIPWQIEQGMQVVASFVADDDPDLYVWIRRFDSADEQERLTAAVYGSERWRDEFDPVVRELIDFSKVRVTTLSPTPGSATP